jgi:hypothetical protein
MLGCAQHFMQLIRDKKFEKAISDDQILASIVECPFIATVRKYEIHINI